MLNRSQTSDQLIIQTDPTKKQILSHLTFLIDNCFSDLKNHKIKLQYFKSKSTYFATTINYFYLSGSKREYVILINEKLSKNLNFGPSSEGIKAILAHELIHIRDYVKSSTLQLMILAFKVFWFKKFNTKYERSIDLRSLEYGFHDGLIEYRNWLYKNISKNQLVQKKRDYLTPEEILQLKMNV